VTREPAGVQDAQGAVASLADMNLPPSAARLVRSSQKGTAHGGAAADARRAAEVADSGAGAGWDTGESHASLGAAALGGGASAEAAAEAAAEREVSRLMERLERGTGALAHDSAMEQDDPEAGLDWGGGASALGSAAAPSLVGGGDSRGARSALGVGASSAGSAARRRARLRAAIDEERALLRRAEQAAELRVERGADPTRGGPGRRLPAPAALPRALCSRDAAPAPAAGVRGGWLCL